MTKLRAPLSIDAALARIAGQLHGGWNEMAQRTERKSRTVRNWGDPDTPEQVPIDCAIVLDLAYQEAGGLGAPIYEAYSARLDLAEAARFADRHALMGRSVEVIREGGEAHAALVRACQPDATLADRAHALREVTEAFEAIRNTIPLLEPEDPAIGPP